MSVPVQSVPVRSFPGRRRAELLTTRQVADLLGIRADSVKKLRYRGNMPEPSPRRYGKSLVWDRDAIERWIVESGRG